MKTAPTLMIDPAALWLKKGGDFYFAEGALSSLLAFHKRRYRILLLPGGKTSAELRLSAWGKNFLHREKIPHVSLPHPAKKSLKEILHNPNCIFVLTPATLAALSLSLKSKGKATDRLIFFSPAIEKGEGEILEFPIRNWGGLSQHVLGTPTPRRATVIRKTSETEIRLTLILDGSGKGKIKTGLHFFDHMLTNFTKHSGIDLTLNVKGDLEVDEHHTIEDTALALGEGFRKALGEKRGLERYGFVLPMDESEAACSIDFSGRSHLEWNCRPFQREHVGDFPTEMLHHFYNSFCLAAGLNMNMKITGTNEHHLIESSFKSLARCLRQALRVSGDEVPSTKGSL